MAPVIFLPIINRFCPNTGSLLFWTKEFAPSGVWLGEETWIILSLSKFVFSGFSFIPKMLLLVSWYSCLFLITVYSEQVEQQKPLLLFCNVTHCLLYVFRQRQNFLLRWSKPNNKVLLIDHVFQFLISKFCFYLCTVDTINKPLSLGNEKAKDPLNL